MATSKILLVENRPDAAQNIAVNLQHSGYQVSAVATSGEEALAQAAELRPDLVLMQMKVGGAIEGTEAAEQILTQLDIPVVYLAGAAGNRTLQISTATPSGYIFDPIDPKKLTSTIEMALYKHDMQRKLRQKQRQLEEAYRREQERRRLSETLREVSRIVSSSLEQQKVLDLILTQLELVVPYHLATINLLHKHRLTRVAWRKKGAVDSAPEHSDGQEEPREPHLPTVEVGKFPLNVETLRQKRPILLPDVRQYAHWQSTPETEPIHSFINAPLLVQGEPIGLLGVGRADGTPYSQEDVETVFAFATQVAIALENARLVEQTQHALHETEGLFEAAQDILSAATLQDIGRNTLRHCQALVRAAQMALYLVDPQQRQITLRALDGPEAELYFHPATSYRELRDGVCGATLQSGATVHFNSAENPGEKDLRPPLSREHGIGAAIVAPLRGRWMRAGAAAPVAATDRVAGVIAALNREGQRRFTQHDVDLVHTLATLAATAIERVRLFEEARAAQESAEQANQAKSDFLSRMSHELRTPLNGILGYAQILRRNGDLTPEQARGVTIIEQSGQHLLNLINDVLDLSKIEAGKMELYPVDFDLPAFLEGVAGMVRITAERKAIAFTYQAQTPLPEGVRADEKRLQQVLINLLGNAVKFTERGEIALRVAATGRDVDDPNAPTATLRFEVADTGIGIAPEHLERIFMPFEQVGAHHLRTEGTGLGLSISRQLVHKMGGELHVTSEPERGSTFWFALKLPEVRGTACQRLTRERNIVGYRGERRRALVVDDKAYNRSVLVNLLASLGFAVSEAESGEQALERAGTCTPDVIFMDLVMPGMSGFAATEAIRRMPALRDIPIIAVTASVSNRDEQRSLDVGCDAFLRKPVQAGALFAALESVLHLHWVYADEDATAPASDDGDATAALLPPPPEEAEALLALARLGDIGALRKRAAHLAQVDARYRPFAHKLLELAGNFDDAGIVALIEARGVDA